MVAFSNPGSRITDHGSRKTRTPSRVLIIGPSNVGDAILASDVIATVHSSISKAEITLVVGERAKALFAGDPRIHTLIDTSLFDSSIGRLKLTARLWRKRPHVIVDLRNTLYPFLLDPLRGWRSLWQPPRRVTHMRDRHLWKLRTQVAGLAAASTDGSSFWASAQDEAQVARLCERWALKREHPLVIICPGARSHIKRWDCAGFAQVADRLIEEMRAQVVFSGEPTEHTVLEDILKLMRESAHSAVGMTTIRQAGVLMKRARLVITNDSASLHLASAVRVPTIGIFGPTDYKKYGPTSEANRTIRRNLFCSPCEEALCRYSHECMRFISPEEIYDAARQLLDTGKREVEGGKDYER